jgi:hypothetical protein
MWAKEIFSEHPKWREIESRGRHSILDIEY